MANVNPAAPMGLFAGRDAPRLYDRVIEVLRVRHYSRRTERAYIHWVRWFILFHGRKHPRTLSGAGVKQFLTHFAVKEQVGGSTQNQALSAILFPYQHVLERPLESIEGVIRARKPKRSPVGIRTPGLPQGSWTPGKGCMIPGFPEEDERCRNGEFSAASSRSRR